MGSGNLRKKLEKLIISLNLEKTFILLGKKANPYPYIKFCNYFCLLSYYEGLPIVLVEAKMLNKYIIATDTAANGVLDDYSNSLIVDNNETNILDGLKYILKNKPVANNKYKYNNEKILRRN